MHHYDENKIEQSLDLALQVWEKSDMMDNWSSPELDSFIKNVTVHKKNIKMLNDFISEGGKFKIGKIDDLMYYDDINKEITIQDDFFFNGNWAELGATLFHEYHHYFAYKQLSHTDSDAYNEKTTQKFFHLTEIGADFNMVQTCFEIGGDFWDRTRIYKDEIQTALATHDVFPGQKIPDELLPSVGNIVLKCFWDKKRACGETLCQSYKKDLVKIFRDDKRKDKGKKNISGLQISNEIGLPLSLSEKQIEDMILLHENEIPPKLSGKISTSQGITPDEVIKAIEKSLTLKTKTKAKIANFPSGTNKNKKKNNLLTEIPSEAINHYKKAR